jgi:hypothetical protein
MERDHYKTRMELPEEYTDAYKYTQLVDFEGDEYTSKATKDTEEARQLIENGYEYVCTTPDEIMICRKRK